MHDGTTDILLKEDEQKMVLPKRKMGRMVKIGLSVLGITVIIVMVSVLLSGRSKIVHIMHSSAALEIGDVSYDKEFKTFVFKDQENGIPYLAISAPYKFIDSQVPAPNSFCRNNFSNFEEEQLDPTLKEKLQKKHSQVCANFENNVKAALYEMEIGDMPCLYVQWYTSDKDKEITNCFKMNNKVNWYGGGGLSVHRWPLNRANVPMQAFLTRQNIPTDGKEANFDSFIEPFFFSSSGVAILVDNHLPLFVSVGGKGKEICFKSAFQRPYDSKTFGNYNLLKYRVCKAKTGKSVHRKIMKSEKILHPYEAPKTEILQKPIWSTRGRSMMFQRLTGVMAFVKNITAGNLPYSMFLIDGNYSRASGNFYFHEKRFSHSNQFIMELLSDNTGDKFMVGTEVFPHVPREKYEQYSVHGTMRNAEDIHLPLFLDVTNEEAVRWYKGQLMDIKSQVSVAGFRFSGGHAFNFFESLEKEHMETKSALPSLNDFTTAYSEIAGELGGYSLMGSGFKSQQDTFVADAGPMASTWMHNKGLKSVIPTVLTYGLLGYPFVLAGPIGGLKTSADSTSARNSLPNKELFIRWLQLSAYLPVMEFSVGPWEYGEKIANYTREVLQFRQQVLWPQYFSGAVKETTETGVPIARPLWWVAPHDSIAQFIDCEFILGRDLLVAPVLYENARGRDIYLPEGGFWVDQLRGKVYKGGQWLPRYRVGLYEIATFKRQPPPPVSPSKG
ncbi:myogenesis-regulating glycosidase [Aplysia californica]|uniref:Myogenesis-regulating glycosidase n=1 Tax=Aplysia californica TaxID=6500 RepID=A0ABM0K374_APLCA|nr:myogenesis-regulating glycosidase [Aplysia californica]